MSTVRPCVRPHFSKSSKQSNIHCPPDSGLAEWIIDDSCLVDPHGNPQLYSHVSYTSLHLYFRLSVRPLVSPHFLKQIFTIEWTVGWPNGSLTTPVMFQFISIFSAVAWNKSRCVEMLAKQAHELEIETHKSNFGKIEEVHNNNGTFFLTHQAPTV